MHDNSRTTAANVLSVTFLMDVCRLLFILVRLNHRDQKIRSNCNESPKSRCRRYFDCFSSDLDSVFCKIVLHPISKINMINNAAGDSRENENASDL